MQKISCFRQQSAAHRLPIKDCGWKSITAYGICASIKPRAADEDTVIKQMLTRSLTTPKCIDCSYLTPILSDKHMCENVLIKTLGLDDNALLLVSECVPVNFFCCCFHWNGTIIPNSLTNNPNSSFWNKPQIQSLPNVNPRLGLTVYCSKSSS